MNSANSIYDVAVVGAGAAGLMASLTAGRGGLRVLLLDSKAKIGAKILMSGGTRCNITNKSVTEKDFETEQKRILSAVLKAFSSDQALSFFKEIGVEVVSEAGGKYFPSTHSGRTVLEALMRAVQSSGVELIAGKKATRIVCRPEARRAEGSSKDVFKIEGDSFSYYAKNVILTTGGLSFPQTGSDGTGYTLAQSFGHSLIPTSPSLTPLLTNDNDLKNLSGVTLPVRLSFFQEGKKTTDYEGSFLFTHTGFSGPVVLDISRHWIRLQGQGKGKAEIFANFLPQFKEESFREMLLTETKKHPSRLVKNLLVEFLPRALVEILSEDVILNQWPRPAREKCIRSLFHFPLPVSGAIGYTKAEVTAGGIDLKEVDKSTMESKLRPGLFLAGEILDVDGRIGGFNFQWAWASGFLAGRGVIKRV